MSEETCEFAGMKNLFHSPVYLFDFGIYECRHCARLMRNDEVEKMKQKMKVFEISERIKKRKASNPEPVVRGYMD